MSKPEYQDIISEYKDQVRILKQEGAELQDAGKAKDSANKRTLQKLEHLTQDLDEGIVKVEYNSPNNMGEDSVELVFKSVRNQMDETTG